MVRTKAPRKAPARKSFRPAGLMAGVKQLVELAAPVVIDRVLKTPKVNKNPFMDDMDWTPRGTKGAMLRKTTQSTGKLQGFIKRGKKFTKKQYKRVPPKMIDNHVVDNEIGGVLTAKYCKYFGHQAFPLIICKDSLGVALTKLFFRKYLRYNITSMSELLAAPSVAGLFNTSQAYILTV